jgi:hypothetical protein
MTAALGAVLVAIGMVDVFLTVLHYDGSSLLARRVNRATWWTVRTATAPLPHRPRSYLRCLGAPLMIPATLAVWLSLLIVGFALLYQPGLRAGEFDIPADTEPGFLLALYTSIVTLSTLGYGDVTPTVPLFQVLAGLEALIGFALLTLAISYVLNVYSVLQHLSLLGAELQQQPADPGDPEGLLAAHVTAAGPDGLGTRLDSLRQRLLLYQEGLRRYPIVYYFRSREAARTLPSVIADLGQLVGALRWGLPMNHPAASNPYLLALLASLTAVAQMLLENRSARARDVSPERASPQALADAVRGRPSSDPYVARFVAMTERIAKLAGVPNDEAEHDLYGRYCQWLCFTAVIDAVTDDVRNDLGHR